MQSRRRDSLASICSSTSSLSSLGEDDIYFNDIDASADNNTGVTSTTATDGSLNAIIHVCYFFGSFYLFSLLLCYAWLGL